jgi:hypothetical protein
MAVIKLDISRTQLADFCEKWQVEEIALFGSVLRDDFRPDSDVDMLITFAPGVKWGLLDHLRMEEELADLLNREIDLFTRRAVEQSRNWMRRREILGTAEVLYGTR